MSFVCIFVENKNPVARTGKMEKHLCLVLSPLTLPPVPRVPLPSVTSTMGTRNKAAAAKILKEKEIFVPPLPSTSNGKKVAPKKVLEKEEESVESEKEMAAPASELGAEQDGGGRSLRPRQKQNYKKPIHRFELADMVPGAIASTCRIVGSRNVVGEQQFYDAQAAANVSMGHPKPY